MRKGIQLLLCSTLLFTSSCDVLDSAAQQAGNFINNDSASPEAPALTNTEVISGLKEALSVGIQNSVNLTSVTDGFFGNAQIKLPFPPDALKVRQKALD